MPGAFKVRTATSPDVWTVIGAGGDEVHIGPSDPGAGYDLWVDSDAVALLTDEARWNTAWGTVGYAQAIATQGGITNTVTDLTSCSVTFTAVSGRRYAVAAVAYPTSTVAVDVVSLRLTTGANAQLQTSDIALATNTHAEGLQLLWVSDGSNSGSTTWKLRMVRFNGTGTISNSASAAVPTFIRVEDAGPINGSVPAPNPIPSWVTLPKQGTWTDEASNPAQYRKIGDIVYLRGSLVPGASAPAISVPVDARPAGTYRLPFVAWNTSAYIACSGILFTSGSIEIYGAGASGIGFVILTGVSWSVT